jgi:WD40 repeat protein
MGCASSIEAKPNQPVDATSIVTGELDAEAQLELEGKIYDENGEAHDAYERTEKKEAGDNALFEVEAAGEGDQFMAVKPWIGALKAPTNKPANNPSPPSRKLELEYVYGYRAIDSRQNLFYTADPNKVVYITAALGVVLDKTNNTQKFFGGGDIKDTTTHNDDIMAIAISPDRKIAATGQVGKNPIICVWNTEDCSLISQFKQGRDTRLVKAIGINKDAQYVASAAADNDHTIFVFDLQGNKLGQQKGGVDPVLDLAWSPVDNIFATAEKRGVSFYTFDGTSLSGKKGIFGGNKMTAMATVAFGPDGKCYSGSIDGALYLWSGASCVKSVQVTTGFINAICVTEDRILVGGKNSITVYGPTLNKISTIPVSAQVRSLDTQGTNVLAGLRDGTLIEIDDAANIKTLMQSHSDGEAWGLSICPNTGLIVTSSDDNKIMTWDPEARKCIATAIVNEVAGVKKKIGGASTLSVFPPNQCARATAINGANGHVAVGLNNGEVHIHSDVNTLKLVKKIHNAKEWIEVIQYSPDGTKCAVGSHDNKIYIYDSTDYNLLATCSKHNSFITALDWSTDSNSIMSICGAYELLFFDANTGQQKTGGATELRDEKWASFTVKLGWPVQGVFPPGTDGSHVNGVDRSKACDIIASADDYGLVNLYRNPCLEGAKANSYRGHSEHVVRVRFDNNDQRLYSIGGYDRTVMQWRLI